MRQKHSISQNIYDNPDEIKGTENVYQSLQIRSTLAEGKCASKGKERVDG